MRPIRIRDCVTRTASGFVHYESFQSSTQSVHVNHCTPIVSRATKALHSKTCSPVYKQENRDSQLLCTSIYTRESPPTAWLFSLPAHSVQQNTPYNLLHRTQLSYPHSECQTSHDSSYVSVLRGHAVCAHN